MLWHRHQERLSAAGDEELCLLAGVVEGACQRQGLGLGQR